MEPTFEDIMDHIIEGTPERPIPLRELSAGLGVSERECKRLIQYIRRDGWSIVSSRGRNNGYYYDPTDTTYPNKLYAEALSRIKTLRGMTTSLGAKELLGQLILELNKENTPCED